MIFPNPEYEELQNANLEFLEVLNVEKPAIVDLYSKESGYSKLDINTLCQDLEYFFQNFHLLYAKVTHIWDTSGRIFFQEWQPFEVARVPWERVLICSSNDAVIPLLPMLIASFCSVGNDVIIAPSRKTMGTANKLLEIIRPIYEPCGFRFELYDKCREMALQEYVTGNKVDFLYFQGCSRKRIEVSNRCLSSGIDLIYEEESVHVAIMDSVPARRTIKEIAERVSEGQNFCNGKLHVSPQTIFINKILREEFISELVTVTDDYILRDDLSEDRINELFNNDGCLTSFNLRSYRDIREIPDLINAHYQFSLEVSLFINNFEKWKSFMTKNFRTTRLRVNMNPLSQHSVLPWGRFRRTGSCTMTNFLEVANKMILIERA